MQMDRRKNELVKYQNDMNKLSFKNFNSMDINIFMALCSQVKEKGTQEIVLTFEDIRKLSNYARKDSPKDFSKELDSMNDKLLEIKCKVAIGSKSGRFVLFPSFWTDWEQETLTISVNKDFVWLLNEMKNYTIFELAEFVELKSKYSKHLYRILKQWRTTGKYIFHDLQEFRELMDVPVKYTNRQLMQDCVSVAVEEIQKLDKSFENFKCEPVYASKRGKPLDKLVFTWKPENVPINEFKPLKSELEGVEGQESFSDCQTFDEYMKSYTGEDKPSPVALKIARDIEKGNKKKQAEPKQNKFINFQQREYDIDELERLFLTTNVPE